MLFIISFRYSMPYEDFIVCPIVTNKIQAFIVSAPLGMYQVFRKS